MTITTTSGTVYRTYRNGTVACPVFDPDQRCRRNYNPFLDWGPDAAAVCGLLVDATLPEDDYRVRAAGPEWREVYDALRAALPA